MVLAQDESSGLRMVVNNDELATFKGDPQTFMRRVQEKITNSASDE